MGVSHADTWTKARDFCASSTIGGVTGWRQPTTDELKKLQAAKVLDGQGWTLGPTWSSTAGKASGSHVALDLSSGAATEPADTASAYVSCVR
jgi:hypothetical protein